MKVVFALSLLLLIGLLIGWTLYRGKQLPPDSALHHHPSNFEKQPVEWNSPESTPEEAPGDAPVDLGDYL